MFFSNILCTAIIWTSLLWLLLSWHLRNVWFLSFSYVLILYYNITSHPSIFHLFSNFKYNLLSTFISFLSMYYRKLLELHNSKIYNKKKSPLPLHIFFYLWISFIPKRSNKNPYTMTIKTNKREGEWGYNDSLSKLRNLV